MLEEHEGFTNKFSYPFSVACPFLFFSPCSFFLPPILISPYPNSSVHSYSLQSLSPQSFTLFKIPMSQSVLLTLISCIPAPDATPGPLSVVSGNPPPPCCSAARSLEAYDTVLSHQLQHLRCKVLRKSGLRSHWNICNTGGIRYLSC